MVAKFELSGYASTHVVLNNIVEDIEKEFGKDVVTMAIEKKTMGGIIYFIGTNGKQLNWINSYLLDYLGIQLTFMAR